MKPHTTRVAGVAVALVMVHAAAWSPNLASAEIIESGGAFNSISPPHSVRKHAFENNTDIRVFLEQESLTLDRDVRVDAFNPGTYMAKTDLHAKWVTAGTQVNSYFIHLDPTPDFGKVILTGTLTFDEDIIGVMVKKRTLWEFDQTLGAPNTLYPLSPTVGRGFELRPDRDWFTIGEDGRSISVNMFARRAMDQMRILTAVPAPAAAALFGLLGLAPRRRRLA